LQDLDRLSYDHVASWILGAMREVEKENEQALTQAESKGYEKGRKNGRQDQHILTINLFNKLRNGRFRFNDVVKVVIDMLKDEMTRELMKDG